MPVARDHRPGNGPRRRKRWRTRADLRLLVLLLSTAFVAPGCGTPCSRIADDHARFLRREGAAGGPPHLALEIPFALANGLIAERLRDAPPIPLGVGVDARLRRYVGEASLAARRLELGPAPAGHVGLYAELAVRLGREPLLTLHLRGRVRPELHAETGHLEFGLRPDDLRAIRPELTDASRDRLAAALRRLVPAPARRLLPSAALVRIAERLLGQATERAHAALRDSLLARFGEVARLRVRVPDLPLASLQVRTTGAHLVILAHTTFAVSGGLELDRPAGRGAPPDVVRLRLAGGTVAELANWAIARGELPDRYDQGGRPAADGDFEPGLAWSPGSRPLKIHLWKTRAPCLQVRLGATPRVRLEGDRLVLAVDDGTIESVKGPLLVEIGAWFYRLGADAIRFSGETARRMRFTLAGRHMRAVVRAARLRRDELVLDLHVTPE